MVSLPWLMPVLVQIALLRDGRAYRQINTIMCETGVIVAYWFTQTGGLSEFWSDAQALVADLTALHIEVRLVRNQGGRVGASGMGGWRP